jgi:hypothetical protein
MALGGKEKGQAILPDLQKGQVREKVAEMVGGSPLWVEEAKLLVPWNENYSRCKCDCVSWRAADSMTKGSDRSDRVDREYSL